MSKEKTAYRRQFAMEVNALSRARDLETPEYVLHEYSQLVDMIRDGYDWEWAEYDNDMWIRDAIQSLLDSDQLNEFAEFGSFRAAIAEQDARLNEALSPQVALTRRKGWWRQRLPIRAEGTFLVELRVLFDYEAIDAAEEEAPGTEMEGP